MVLCLTAKQFTASIVQGSGLGPSLFIIIYTKETLNLFKYADDTSLLVEEDFSKNFSSYCSANVGMSVEQ